MKTKSFVLLLFIMSLFAHSAMAQTFSVKWSDATKYKFDFDDAVLLDNGTYMVLKLEPKSGGFGAGYTYTPILVLVGKDMEIILERTLEINEKNSELDGLVRYGENIFFKYSAYDKDSKTTSFYAIKIDQANLSPISKTTLGTFESDKKSDQAEATFKFSSDSSKVMLMVEGPERKKETEKLYFGIFDTDLKKIWSKQVELPIEQRFMDIHDVDVSNDGKVYLAIKHYEKEVKKETVREDGSKVPAYVYKMLIFDNGTDKEKEIRMDFQGLFVQGTKLINNKEGIVTVAGLYKTKYNGNITGVFYANLDSKTSDIKNPKIVPFPEDLLALVAKDKYASAKEKDPGLYSYFRMRNIVYRNNGSVDLICEYYKLVISTYTSQGGGTRTTYNYYYGDIVNTNINSSGAAVFTRVPKNQKDVNSNSYLGFTPIIYKDKLVLLYNDDEDNIERDLDKKPDDVMKFSKSVFLAAIIDAKGNLTREAIYSHKDESYITIPRFARKIDDNKYLIKSQMLKTFKKRIRFGVLTVK